MSNSYFESLIVLRDAYLKAYTLTGIPSQKRYSNDLDNAIKRERNRRLNQVRSKK